MDHPNILRGHDRRVDGGRLRSRPRHASEEVAKVRDTLWLTTPLD